ncbi:hypothetical protein KW843_25860 [Acidovorax sp. sif1233]|jgi:hypothetical protein|uniref:hypothetical protein n=1 Tax=Acidovorax sp. sif1233 TaxID=2854792 RepID=UPI001C4769EC|nr:hypothetical protein [Acidovorax sp. sif1233]MBV7457926.1 hypothetical protein [Acidovorax sp. sif1233]
MPTPRIDLTVINDSSDDLVVPRSALLQVDLIATVVDVECANFAAGAKTKLTLMEACSGPGAPQGARTLLVMESYKAVCMLIKHADL